MVISDEIIENEEIFTVAIDSADRAVAILPGDRSRTVQLVDSTSMFICIFTSH
jgi:hypothetical protein